MQMGKLTQRFNNLPKVTAGKWRIWLQKPSESLALPVKVIIEMKQKSTPSFSFRVQSMLEPKRQCV